MNKACEYCQYNGPYGSIINPCENCHNNDFRTATTTTTTDMKTLQISYGKNTGDVYVFVTGLSTNLPTAKEYRALFVGYPYNPSLDRWSEPKYICPECGGGMCRNETMILTSNPPQYEYKCNKCGHIEYQLG